MAINTEQKRYLVASLEDSGFTVRTRNGLQNYYRDNGTLVTNLEITVIESLINNFDPLPISKTVKIKELKSKGLSRVQLVFPAIKDWDDLDLVRDQWLSIAPAARSATANFQSMIDIFQAGKVAVAAINALTTVAEVEAYNVVNTPSWP
jgi:hypothetical protein